MHCPDTYTEVEQMTSTPEFTGHKKLTTGEYGQLLRQQYERLAQHQQVIEAEWQAEGKL
jgi:hypothetical protein